MGLAIFDETLISLHLHGTHFNWPFSTKLMALCKDVRSSYQHLQIRSFFSKWNIQRYYILYY